MSNGSLVHGTSQWENLNRKLESSQDGNGHFCVHSLFKRSQTKIRILLAKNGHCLKGGSQHQQSVGKLELAVEKLSRWKWSLLCSKLVQEE